MPKGMNEVAWEVSKLEGKKINLSIAQIKEVIKCLRVLCQADDHTWYGVQQYLRYARTDKLAPMKKRDEKKEAR